MIPNSIVGPADTSFAAVCLEPFKTGTRNVLWLTVREGRRFILKGLPEELRSHPEEIARLRKEFSLGIRISHPGVVGVYGFEMHPTVGPVIVMEYVDGITLNEYLAKDNLLAIKVRMNIAHQIAEALACMHSMGLSHRDLKPDNILVTRRNEAKIIDIGLGDSEDSVIYKESLGTEGFGAPEQQMPCVGDSQADVYSFGRILEMLLPEKKFRKLRAGCLQENPDKRVSMQEAAESIRKMHNDNKMGIRTFLIVSCVVIVVGVFSGIITLKNVSATVHADVSQGLANAENRMDKPLERTIDEKEKVEIGNDVNRNVNVVVETPPKVSDEPLKSVLGKEKITGDVDYDKIFKKYMAEVYNDINKYGCGYDAQQGMYIDSIVNARSKRFPDISVQMVNELMEAGCPDEEIMRYGDLMIANMKEAMAKVDGIKFE